MSDIYIVNRNLKTSQLISKNDSGQPGRSLSGYDTVSKNAKISGNGKFVVYETNAANIIVFTSTTTNIVLGDQGVIRLVESTTKK